MNSSSDIKTQLQSLRIGKEQRPAATYATRRRHWGRWFLLIVLAGAGVAGYLHREQLAAKFPVAANAADVRIITVQTRSEPPPAPVLTATGKIVSDHKVQVATKVSGQITALFFEQGDRVQQGQRLATIEDVIYHARRDEAAAQLAKAEANLAFQKYNYARVQGLVEQRTAAQVEQADATRQLHEGEAQVAACEASLKYAQKALDDCVVTAPIAGVILERNVEVGDFVAAEGGRGANANAQFALIADMTKLRVQVDVSELDIARIVPDMPCTIAPEAYKSRKYSGHVLWIDPGADYSKATVQVKVRIDDPDDYLRVEGSAQVLFLPDTPTSQPAGDSTAASQPAQIWIPAAACAIDAANKTTRVFVASNGCLHAQPISVGRQQSGLVEVLDGLHAGDSIAAERVEQLTDGQRIRP